MHGILRPCVSVWVVDVADFCDCVGERECAVRVYYQPLKNTLFFADRTQI